MSNWQKNVKRKSNFERSTNEMWFNDSCSFIDTREEARIKSISLSSQHSTCCPKIYSFELTTTDKTVSDFVKSTSTDVRVTRMNQGSFFCPDYTYQLSTSTSDADLVISILEKLNSKFPEMEIAEVKSGILEFLGGGYNTIATVSGSYSTVTAQAAEISFGKR